MASNSTINKRVNIYINGREVSNNIKSIRAEMQKTVNEQAKMTIGSEEYIQKTKEIRQFKAIIQEHNRQLQTTQRKWFSINKIADGFNKYFGMLTAGIASITGIIFGFKKLSEEVAKMDDVYSDVSKTTNLTRNEVLALNESFKKLDTRTSREELNRLAADAGKLGISGKQDILEFVDAGNQINVALGEDLGEGAIKNIGKISQVFKASTSELKNMGLKEQMLSIGSAINELGQSSTASEAYLVDFAKRLGGVAAQSGISIQNILGYASALDQSGQAVEMSATALQNFIMKLMAHPAKFARLAGKEISSFTKLLQTDTNEAILQILKSLNQHGGFQALIPIFQEMGLDGARAVGVLSSLATNINLVTEAQKVANEGFAAATSITDEYDKKNNNMQATLEKSRKVFKENALILAEKLAPAMITCTNKFTAFIKLLIKLPRFYDENKRLINALAIAFTTFATQALLRSVYPAIQKVGKAMSMLNKTIKANPVGLLLTGLSFAISYLISFTSSTESAIKANGELASAIKSETKEINNLVAQLTNSTTKESDRKKILQELHHLQPKLVEGIDAESIATETLTKRVQEYNDEQIKRMALATKQDALNEAIQKQANLEMELVNQEAEARKLLVNIQTELPDLKIKKKNGNQSIWDWKEITENEKQELIEQFNKIFTSSDDWTGKILRTQQLFPQSTSYSRKFGTLEYKGIDLSGLDNILKRISELHTESDQASTATNQLKADIENFTNTFSSIFNKTTNNNLNAELIQQIAKMTDKKKLQEYLLHQDQAVKTAAEARLTILAKENTGNIDLIKQKEKELEIAQQMPGRTREEITTRNQKIQAIQREIEELNKLGLTEQKQLNAENTLAKKISEIRSKLEQYGMTESMKEILQVQNKYDELLEICQQYGLDETEIIQLRDEEIAQIEAKYQSQSISEFIATRNQIEQALMSSSEREKANIREKYEELIALAEEYGIDTTTLKQKMNSELEKVKNPAGMDLFGMTEEDWEKLQEKITMAIDMAGQLSNIWGQFNQIQANRDKKELQDYEKSCNRKKELLNKQLNSGRISQEQYNARVSQLDADLEKKKTEIAKKQAKRDKAQSIFSTIINTASAVVQALNGPWPASLVFAALAAAMGAAQIAVIASQPLPEYAEGGMTKGAKMYIAGEAGQEWIAPNDMLQDPITGPIINRLEMVRSGIISPEQLILPDFQTMSSVPLYSTGGYTYTPNNTAPNNYTETTNIISDQHLESIDEKISKLIDYLSDPKNRQATISNDLLRRNEEELNMMNRLKRI